MKRWTHIFKTLANINRLKIIKLLSLGKAKNVTDIAFELKISLNATSKHLIMLEKMEVLESDGHAGHVFYKINPAVPADFQKVIHLMLK